ncbi:stereocilin [Diretmus argenteus]
MKMAEKGPGMASLGFTSVIVCVILLGQASTERTGGNKEDRRNVIFRELISKWNEGGGLNPHKNPPETSKDRPVHPLVRSIVGGLKTLGFLRNKDIGLPSLNKPMDRHRLSSFLYNISQYLQEMGAELEERQTVSDEELWEKVLNSLIQSEGSATLNQWNGQVPPRPSVRLQDWFLSLRGSPHWDWFLGLLQSLLSLSERQPYRPFLAFLSQNWRTVSAVLEAMLQALVSGTYGQASAGLQGFICALKGRSDCAFNVSWLQQLLLFLETRNWKPVVSLHPAGQNGDQNKGSAAFGRLKPFSLPPEATREDSLSGNASLGDRTDTGDDLDSMQTLLLQALSRSGGGERASHLAERNPALVQSLDGLRRGLLHRVGSSVYGNLRKKVSQVTMALLDDVSSLVDVPQPNPQGRCSVGDLRQLILWGIRHNVTWNTQALGFNSQGLPSTLPFLSCPSTDGVDVTSRQTPSHSTNQATLSSRTTSKLHHPHDLPATPSQSWEGKDQQKEVEYSTSELLEAACNASIPGLTGVSNFTVFLYCNLFEGENGSVNTAVGQLGLDLHATCSDAAWYLSAAEDDFFWVHVCSEFFAHEFNNTVCANSSFWLQRAHQAAETKDFHYFNQSSIDDLCVQLSGEAVGRPGLDENCLAQLGSRSLTAQDFRHCFLPNNSVLIAALCGIGSPDPHHSFPEGSWAAAYCSKIHNSRHVDTIETCHYRKWAMHHFTNSTLLELCMHTHGLREYICLNASIYHQQLKSMPHFSDVCADLEEQLEGRKCVLQRFFDMLPAPYEFDTSQLCVNPAPLLVEALHKLSVCEVEGAERGGFLVALGYVLRVLDFMVGLSSGLEEGEGEARQGLGQAILLSSLLDNTSFWATMQPEASMSVLHTVGLFLRREQNSALKEDLLSCFSPVLWDLIQQEDNSSALRVLLQEYLQMPRESIRTLVMSAEKDAVKRFISHMHQSWDQLHVETTQASQKELQAMETMTAAFIHKFPRVTPELFVDLSQFIPFMSVSDIMSFPASLMVNDSVLMAIRDHSSEMKSLQKKAFVKRLLQSNMVGDVPTWPPYFLSSILPLLPYLPVVHFQQLTSQQLIPLVELLGNSSLDGTRGRYVLRTLFNKRMNLTSDNVLRLGVLACYLDPLDLHPFLQTLSPSSAIWQQLGQCMSKGLISADGRLSTWLIPVVQTLNASSMPPPELSALSGLLPQLGASFLQSYPSEQIWKLLTQPGLHRYSPAQAFQILSKISKDTNLTMETLCRLKPLHPGLSPAVLRNLHWPEIGGTAQCQCWSNVLTELKPGQRAMLYNAMQEGLQRGLRNITLQVHCLLPFVPLRKLAEDVTGETILRDISRYRDLHWSAQQAELLFKKIHEFENITIATVKDLGHIASGMSCDWMRLWTNETDFSELLQFVSGLPGGVRPALRKCIVAELRNQPEIDLSALNSWFAATLPVKMTEDFSNTSFRAVLDHIQRHFPDFLKLPHYKQMNLAEKAITALGSEGEIKGTTLDLLGPLLPFLDQDSLALVDRRDLILRLDEMRGYCLPREGLRDIGALLTGKDLLGEPSKWEVGNVEHLGRLVFSLSSKQINSIPLSVLNKDTVEQVLVGQTRWEDSAVGRVCVTRCMDQHRQKEQTQRLIRGIVRARSRRAKEPVPSCADIRGIFPSAWTSTQLSRMSQEDLKLCVEVVGQDASLSSEQRRSLWLKLRPAYSPVRELRADQVLALGSVVTEMGDRELQDTNLTDLGVLAHLGTLTHWSHKKMRAVIVGVMRRRKLKVEKLTAVDLATLGHLICGLYPSEINRLDPYNLSMAVVFLREMALPCTEQQMEVMTGRLSSPEAFGPVSAWGPEVFTEIGTLAAGLGDMVLSALVQEQVEGITPETIALIPPKKMAVVFSATQLSWLSVEQAWAVTDEQLAELDRGQKRALSLAQYEGDDLLDLRGFIVLLGHWCAVTVPFCVSALHVPWAAPACQRDTVLRDCAALGEPMAFSPPSPSIGPRVRLVELLLGPLLVLLVFGPGTALGQKVYTNTWAVHIPGGQEEADRIASKHGFISHGHVFGDYYHFRHRMVVKRSLSDHRGTQVRLQREPKVTWAEQQVVKQRKKRDIFTEPSDPKFRDQWYLYNGNHRDLNATGAWELGYTGKGVVVSILDDGIEKNHPDLSQNYDPDASYDVNDGDPDPQPRYTQLNDNRHGTRCAGEVAAVANNGICGVGVAYNAKIGGVRMLDGEVTDVVEAQSLGLNPQHIHIYSASWGPEDDGKTVDGPAKLAKEAFLRGVTEGRGGLGSIFVWASGNGGREKDSCNCDGYTNSIYTLSISSSTQNGNVPWYSEACSSTLATTYSSGNLNEKQIVTTDLKSKCTDSHTGTSASAPLAAGIIALALEAKNIGSNLVISKSVDACIGTANHVSSVEHVQAQLTLSYNRRGNLAIHLISSQGTRSTLLAPSL